MKVSVNWIKEFTPVDMSVEQLVQKIGAQLGAIDEVIDLGEKYKGIVIAKVITCQQHPNADKLKVCRIDDGSVTSGIKRNEQGYIEVVCGAPNVREGLLVAWLPPGVTVPATYNKDPLVLEAREIRGIVSNGMLASARELGLSDNHDGILELGDVAVGGSFAEIMGLDDYIIDIENKMFTHRPDCFGILGVAREIAGITHSQFTSPDWYIKSSSLDSHSGEGDAGLEVTNEIPELCPRYMAAVLCDVKVGPSPLWLQASLSKIGIRPINNIVDMTNYLMVLTGQPLHAFDFDKIAKDGRAKIIVRKPKTGEKITLLDGKTIEPREDAILICDQDKPIALGGVMGGNNSEIDEHTTRIIIECANFDMYNIRKTSMEHGIFSDSVTRFTKGQSPLQCPPVLSRAMGFTQDVSPGAKPVGKVVDANQAGTHQNSLAVTSDFINTRLGMALSATDMAQLLGNVEFAVSTEDDVLKITAPFWRTDIEIPEDVVEEVGRLYGYDHLPLELPGRDLTPAPKNGEIMLKNTIRGALSKAGANELLTYSFIDGSLLQKVGQDKERAYTLANALSPDLQYYRLSLTPSLLERVYSNIRAGFDEFALFEINKIHMKEQQDPSEPNLPKEDSHIALVFAANEKCALAAYNGSAYYQVKKYLEQLRLLEGCDFIPLSAFDLKDDEWGQQMVAPYEPLRSAAIVRDGMIWGVIGEYRQAVQLALKLPAFSAGFEVALDVLHNQEQAYVSLPRFPKVEQDISLKVPVDLVYSELLDLLQSELERLKPTNTLAQLWPVDIFQREGEKEAKQVTLRLTIAAYDRTLTAEAVNALLNEVALAANKKFGAERL